MTLSTKEGFVNRGTLFEIYVQHIFRKGGKQFHIRSLDDDTCDMIMLPSNPKIQYFKEAKELREAKDGELWIPVIPNFPCVDIFIAPEWLFQNHHIPSPSN